MSNAANRPLRFRKFISISVLDFSSDRSGQNDLEVQNNPGTRSF
jgi:hypothetical protein